MSACQCQRCGEAHSRADAFLLTCRGCGKNWHHRCLMPPMADEDLVNLIRATNKKDTAHDLSSWSCRRCRKRASETPSATSSRAQTVASDTPSGIASSRGSALRDSTPPSSVASIADVRVKQESRATIETRLVDDRERNRQESTEAAPLKHALVPKRTQSTGNVQPDPTQSGDTDVSMADIFPAKPTLQEKKRSPRGPSPPTHLYPVKAARKFGSSVSTRSSEDVEMQVDPPTPRFSEPASRVSQTPSLIWPEPSVEPPPVHTANATNEQEGEARPPVVAAIQPQVTADEVDDDPEDLYGPPVERRIVRILPSLAEELREQQRRVAVEKEKRRAPLAPDWILARHVNDPLWKDMPMTEGRKRRKASARRLGDNGLNVSELMSCYTVENWVRGHKN